MSAKGQPHIFSLDCSVALGRPPKIATIGVAASAGMPVGLPHRIVENDDEMRSHRHIVSRALLVAFTLWALAMIIPDFYRVYQPLGSFGFYANNDGIITDVQGPFVKQT